MSPMGTLIDGKAIAKKIEAETVARIDKLKKKHITPRLEVILVGDDQASLMYDRMKGAAAQKIGIDFALHQFLSSITAIELTEKITAIQKNAGLSGLILQLPLPDHLYTPNVLNTIDPRVDVDFLTNERLGTLIMNTNT